MAEGVRVQDGRRERKPAPRSSGSLSPRRTERKGGGAAPGLRALLSEPAGLLYLQATAGNAAVTSALNPSPPQARFTVQRYDSYEHVEAGAVESFMEPAESAYVVGKGETPAQIARKLSVTVDRLLERNRKKVHLFAIAGGGHEQGFEAGDTIVVPSDKLRIREPAPSETVKTDQKPVTINGVTMSYGEAMAMADFYQDFAAMEAAKPAEIKALLALVRKQVATPGSVSQADWDTASGGRYMDLNRKNTAHFAPSDARLVPASGASSGSNHKEAWEANHRLALDAAQKGDRDRALAINAFGDHFLTDAFAAGHLFNKEDLMKKVRLSLSTTEAVEAFASPVATEVFKDPASKTICSVYENVHTSFKTAYGRWSINSASRFASVLEGIDARMPDVLENSIAAAVHDDLNAKGVHVSNTKASWTVKGDDNLEPTALFYMREAVSQSQVNVLNAAGAATVDYAKAFKAVWDLAPQPDTSGRAEITKAVTDLADPKSATTVTAVGAITKANLQLIMDKVEAAGEIRKIK